LIGKKIKKCTSMQSKKFSASKLSSTILSIIIVCLTIQTLASVNVTKGIDENYTYYGAVPSKIYRYILNNGNNRTSGWILSPDNSSMVGGSVGHDGFLIATKALLAVVASEDDTDVEIYSLSNGSLLSRKTINRMEKDLVLINNGTQFKVVSDKIVSVLLLNYQEEPSAGATEGPLPYTFYQSVDGLYVGKEFVFMASYQPATSGYGGSAVYSILSLEKSDVTVTDEDGVQDTYSLEVNSHRELTLVPFKIYRIESTGNIMVQSIFLRFDVSDPSYSIVPCFCVPSVEGGFVGEFFIIKSMSTYWDNNKDYGYRIMAQENSQVKVYDLETQQLMNDLSITGGSGIAIRPKANAIIVQSDKPVTVSLVHNGSIVQSRGGLGGLGGEYQGYGHGVMFMGIKPNQDTMIHLPVDANVEAYFFAEEATQLTIDGNTETIQANTGFLYTTIGTHTVSADHNVVLQVNFWPLEPEYQGLWFTGAAIPCVETVDMNPTVTITQISGGGFPIMYVAIGGGAAAVVAVVVVMVLRKRSSKPS
jgi:hypothetical protein